MTLKYHRLSWKYVLDETYEYSLNSDINDWIVHERESDYYKVIGSMVCAYKGYAWDGASGPTFDTSNSMRASLVHDILYQAIREGVISKSYRRLADREFRLILKEDGMHFFRRWSWWYGVRICGGQHIKK